MVHLRTRKVRLPIPTQRQLDNARKFLSTYEEQGVYDIFRLPFVMPNGGNSPPASDEEGKESKAADKNSYSKGGLPGVAAKVKGKVKDLRKSTGGSTKELGHSARVPGLSSGAPSWIEKEFEAREKNPKSSPSSFGLDAPSEPYEHFEMMRAAQKEYWCAEAYSRVCFLYGIIHLIQSFAYWLALHCVAELAMAWCAFICPTALTAGIWVMFRLDVLADHGGCLPMELAGPIVSAASLILAYTHDPTSAVVDISRGVGIAVIFMQIGFTYRMYAIATPSYGMPDHSAKETGGRLFNQTASCDRPSWLPTAFQHVAYLIAPPKTADQLAKEKEDREMGALKEKEDPLVDVDMTPWYHVRALIFFTLLGWLILLSGRVVECVMGERMIVSNGGAPPWTRTGQWNGWEFGPVSSKHYAHVTPQRGHFAWQKGWGPQGRQELWASDMFGFHPEADMHWHEDVGPDPLQGAAGQGKNTWALGVIMYGASYHGPQDWSDDGGHRRLRSVASGVVRPLVPAAVQWPALLEPELLACSPQGEVAAFTSGGLGAFVPAEATSGRGTAAAASVMLEGLLELGMLQGVSWGNSGLIVATSSGAVASCPLSSSAATATCSPMTVPKLPVEASSGTVAVFEPADNEPLRAAVVAAGGRVVLYELTGAGLDNEWRMTAEVLLPLTAEGQVEIPEIVAVSAKHDELLVTAADGSTYQWRLLAGKAPSSPLREAPAAGPRRSWKAACAQSGKVLRLASNWRRTVGGATEWQTELLI